MNHCNVRNCSNPAQLQITYDCGDSEPEQTTELCMDHYESYDTMANGERFYYFKKFAKSVEVMA